MFLSVYYEDSRACDAHSIRKVDVEVCSKGILALCAGHGKSPCFLDVGFLLLLGVDARVLKVVSLDGANFLECAFCHGKG